MYQEQDGFFSGMDAFVQQGLWAGWREPFCFFFNMLKKHKNLYCCKNTAGRGSAVRTQDWQEKCASFGRCIFTSLLYFCNLRKL